MVKKKTIAGIVAGAMLIPSAAFAADNSIRKDTEELLSDLNTAKGNKYTMSIEFNTTVGDYDLTVERASNAGNYNRWVKSGLGEILRVEAKNTKTGLEIVMEDYAKHKKYNDVDFVSVNGHDVPYEEFNTYDYERLFNNMLGKAKNNLKSEIKKLKDAERKTRDATLDEFSETFN